MSEHPDTGSDETISALVRRLARPHPSGGDVIERSVILAEGADSAAIIAWIAAHEGVPEMALAAAPGGLHGGRQNGVHSGSERPLRFVLPAGSFD